jgi:hypothetical protein
MQTAVRAATLFTAVAASLIFTSHAKAATDIGVVSGYATFDSQTTDGAFEDFFTFTVDTRSKGVFAVTGVALTPTIGIAFSMAQLYTGSFSSTASLDPTKLIANSAPEVGTTIPNTSVVINTTVGQAPLSLAPLTTYTLYVKGTSGGDSSYVGIIALAPVPEPETYAMLLAGLGLMGTIAQRRRKSR